MNDLQIRLSTIRGTIIYKYPLTITILILDNALCQQRQ